MIYCQNKNYFVHRIFVQNEAGVKVNIVRWVLGSLVCDIVTFPYGVLGQVLYFVLISDLGLHPYFTPYSAKPKIFKLCFISLYVYNLFNQFLEACL